MGLQACGIKGVGQDLFLCVLLVSCLCVSSCSLACVVCLRVWGEVPDTHLEQLVENKPVEAKEPKFHQTHNFYNGK